MNIADIQWNMSRPYGRQAHFAEDRMAGTVPIWHKGSSSSSSLSSNVLTMVGEPNPEMIAPTLSFAEALDIVNPLQHVPVVNEVYRAVTGDDLSPVAKIAGGTLYGGVLGGLVSLMNAASEEHAGDDLSSALWAKTFSKPQNSITVAAVEHNQPYQFND